MNLRPAVTVAAMFIVASPGIRIDSSWFADKVIRIRAVAEGEKQEKVLWVKDLLADDGKSEIQATIAAARKGP